MLWNQWIGMNSTTSTPISVLRYDVDKGLLRSGILTSNLSFVLRNKSRTQELNSLFGCCCCCQDV